MPINLGPFRLAGKLGLGGMGVVWDAVHIRTGTPVAVKVLDKDVCRTREYVRALHHEVHQVARLHHPNIVWVLDTGVIDHQASDGSHGELVAGSPYVAMERASGGTLRKLGAPADFKEVLRVTRALLDALGHAHARGVLHRDLKPENVLLDGPGDERPGLKLSDFGISLSELDPLQDRQGSGGSPGYMPPEQVAGDWRDQGPWTDLYALGCVAWELMYGFRPSDGVSPPPDAAPRWFEEWLRTLLAAAPSERFPNAPTARVALEDRAAAVHPSLEPGWFNTGFLDGQPHAEPLDARRMRPPPLPKDWRGAALVAAPPLPLVDAGLSLFARREPEIVGRDNERSQLWSTLTRCVQQRGGGFVLVRGDAGFGKTHLVQWFVHAIRESGCADVLLAKYGTGHGAPDGLTAAIRERLTVQGLPEPERLERARSRLGEHDGSGSRLLESWLRDAGPGATSEDAVAAAMAWLELSSATAVVVVLEDIENAGPEALQLARMVVTHARRPFLVVATLGSTAADAASDKDPGALDLAAWAKLGRADPETGSDPAPRGPADGTTIDLRGLDSNALRGALSSYLVLADELLVRVVARAGGVPLIAVELVRAWIEQGALVATAGAFDLVAGASTEIPDRVFHLFDQRIERAGLTPGQRRSLEALALLGSPCIAADWTAVCSLIGADAPDTLQLSLMRHHLAEPNGAGAWRLAHVSLAECLERSVRRAGTWSAVHEACASVVAAAPERAGRAARVGRHLLEAGRAADSVESLDRAARESIEAGASREAAVAIELLHRALDVAKVPALDRGRGRADLFRARLELGRGRRDAAEEILIRTANRFRGDPEVYPNAVRLRALVLRQRMDYDGAEALLLRAEVASAADPRLLALVRQNLGVLARNRGGDLKDALTPLGLAREAFQALGDEAMVASCDHEIGTALLTLGGSLDEAEEHLRAALPVLERIGRRYEVGACQLALGNVYRKRGDPVAAGLHLEAAHATLRNIRSPAEASALGNLAFQALRDGDGVRARGRLEEAEAVPGRSAQTDLYVDVGFLTCAAMDSTLPWRDRSIRVLDAAREGRLDDECHDLLRYAHQRGVGAGRTDLAAALMEILAHLG